MRADELVHSLYGYSRRNAEAPTPWCGKHMAESLAEDSNIRTDRLPFQSVSQCILGSRLSCIFIRLPFQSVSRCILGSRLPCIFTELRRHYSTLPLAFYIIAIDC